MLVQGSASPQNIWTRYIDENNNVVIRLTKNVVIKNVTDEITKDTRQEYEYDEIEISVPNRDNLEQYIETNFDLFFEKDLELTKQNKIKELDKLCQEKIYGGFYSNADGENKLYDFEIENQINMMGLMPQAQSGKDISYYAKGEQCHNYTSTQFLQLVNDGATFKFNTIEKYKQLKNYVNSLGSVDEINKVNFYTVISTV